MHLYLEVEVQESCFLHLTRKSRFLQYVQEIFLHLCSILHLCVGNFPAFCRKFPTHVQYRDSSIQICTKKTFCRKISGTFVEN